MSHCFFLGGHDLEMLEIGQLVRAAWGKAAVVDRGLPWNGAVASAYLQDIEAAVAAERTPVLVELRDDLPAELSGRCVHVDHHGARAGADAPTALEQVFALLGLPKERWTRRMALVAANDRGWIPELRAMGATDAEIAAIRAEDRAAQGVTAAEEAVAEAALARAERRLEGSLVLVRLPHARTSPVLDRLALQAGEGEPPDVLVLSPEEVNFSGRGARVLALDAAFPGGWRGGALPARGFWGRGRPLPDEAALLRVLAEADGRSG